MNSVTLDSEHLPQYRGLFGPIDGVLGALHLLDAEETGPGQELLSERV